MGVLRTNAGPGQPLPRPRLPPPTAGPNQWRAPPWTGHGSSGPPPWAGQGPSRPPPPWAGQGSSGPPPGWGPPPQRPPTGADAPPWNQGYHGPSAGEYDQNYAYNDYAYGQNGGSGPDANGGPNARKRPYEDGTDYFRGARPAPTIVRMRGIPWKATRQEVEAFFLPLVPWEIELIKDENNRPSGIGRITFQSPADARESLKKNRQFLGDRYIELYLEQPHIEYCKRTHFESERNYHIMPGNEDYKRKHETDAMDRAAEHEARMRQQRLQYQQQYEQYTDVATEMQRETLREQGDEWGKYWREYNEYKRRYDEYAAAMRARGLPVAPMQPPAGAPPPSGPMPQTAPQTGGGGYY